MVAEWDGQKEAEGSPAVSPRAALLAGAMGGIGTVVCGHPFDLLKVRLQSTVGNANAGLFGTLASTYRLGGVPAFYRGAMPVLMGVAPVYALAFASYEGGRQLSRYLFAESNSVRDILFGGALSGLAVAPVLGPAERVKIIIQTRTSTKQSFFAAAGGIRGLFRGTGLTMMRDVPGSMAYFLVYEETKRRLSGLGGAGIIIAGGVCWQ